MNKKERENVEALCVFTLIVCGAIVSIIFGVIGSANGSDTNGNIATFIAPWAWSIYVTIGLYILYEIAFIIIIIKDKDKTSYKEFLGYNVAIAIIAFVDTAIFTPLIVSIDKILSYIGKIIGFVIYIITTSVIQFFNTIIMYYRTILITILIIIAILLIKYVIWNLFIKDIKGGKKNEKRQRK